MSERDQAIESEAGRVGVHDGRRSLRFVRSFPTTVDDLWSAITDPDRMGRWAFAGYLEPRVGGIVRFDFDETGSVEGTVLVWDAPNVLEYEWAEGDGTWHVRFELADDGGGGTTLTFDHFLPNPSAGEYAAGWHWHLDRLGQLTAGQAPTAVEEDQHFHDLMARYGASSAPTD